MRGGPIVSSNAHTSPGFILSLTWAHRKVLRISVPQDFLHNLKVASLAIIIVEVYAYLIHENHAVSLLLLSFCKLKNAMNVVLMSQRFKLLVWNRAFYLQSVSLVLSLSTGTISAHSPLIQAILSPPFLFSLRWIDLLPKSK